ncbi:LLM class flavin-dependent oxidoreductase [Streptomyces xanthochromogenes]|uniref:LLM class flavin-dependent oxidoreductase n=1 Tax=Streptomyces xanthochromogenes TaxID=67384 RepID=UPI00341FACA1
MTRRGFRVYGTAHSPHAEEPDPKGRVVRIAQRAETYRMDGLLIFYNHQNFDPWVIAATVLQNTSTITPLVALQPYALPPFTAAKIIHNLTVLHGRRLDLNLITGAAKEELDQVQDQLSHDERYQRAIEYATVVRSLLSSNKPFFHEGAFYQYRGLKTETELPPEQRPRLFVAGSSKAGREAAAAVADVAVTHPEPLASFASDFATPERAGLGTGIRVGLLARATDEEAWLAAREHFPSDRLSHLKTVMRQKSESDWSRRLARLTLAGGTYDDVYWTGAYHAGKGSAPLLVGSYERVAEYLGRYLALGVSNVLLGGLSAEEEFRHSAVVLSQLRTQE